MIGIEIIWGFDKWREILLCDGVLVCFLVIKRFFVVSDFKGNFNVYASSWYLICLQYTASGDTNENKIFSFDSVSRHNSKPLTNHF